MKMQDITIVMIEDDLGHSALIEKNLRRAGIFNPLVKLTNGREALEHFFGTEQAPREHINAAQLILLDINLPEVDGFQILEKLKADERTRLIPVIILTTTDNPEEIERGYELGCNIYVTKPVDYEGFAECIRKLGLMLSVVKIPD